MISATIGGLTFTSDPTSIYGLETLDGWYSSAPTKTRVFERSNSDGAFGVSTFYRGARVVTMAGLFVGAGDNATAFAQWQGLSGLLASGATQTLSVTDPAGTFTSDVMLYGNGSTLEPLLNGMARYVVTFLAFDPVKYSPWRSTVISLAAGAGGLEYNLGAPAGALYYGGNGELGRGTLTNAGNADVWPTFSVTGALSNGFFIQCLETGQVIRYDRVVPAGTTVSLNSRTGSVLVDSVSDASTYITRDEWFSIPAGTSRTIQFNAISGSSGTPLLTVRDADGYR